jgi:S-adenosylmethionine synthetase
VRSGDVEEVRAVVEEELSRITELTKLILEGKVRLF